MAITFDSNNQEETARKGRNSQNEVNKRYDICYKLLRRKNRFKNYDNFLTYYRQALKEANINVPTAPILYSDVSAVCQRLREDGIFIDPLMKGKSTAFQEFGEKHKGEIYRVYLSVNGCEYRLFSKRGKHDYLKNYSNYKELLGKIFGNLPHTAAQPFDFENPYSFIGHLYIVLYEEGLEESISELYMKYCKDRVLYVANHRRCSEIVFDIQKKNRILQATYRLLKGTTKWKPKKKS